MQLMLVPIDVETGEYAVQVIDIEDDKCIKDIRHFLPQKGIEKSLYFYNQAEKVEEQTKIKDVFSSYDIITIDIGEVSPSKGYIRDKWKSLKSVTNNSGVKVIMVLRTKGSGVKMSFTEERWDSIDYSKWGSTVEFCWATGQVCNGSQKYLSRKYKLDESNAKYIIEKDKLLQQFEGSHEPILMVPTKIGNKLDSHFKNGKMRTFAFTNSGINPLYVISGRKTKFTLSPPILPGFRVNIEIKENKHKFEFGVTTDNPDAASIQEKEFSVLMFDSELVNAESFLISKEGNENECKVAAIRFDQTTQIIASTRIKKFIRNGL